MRQALALGALHGPAELLPVSSSAHVALVPQLLGWPYASLEASERKSFEVAAHAGAALGLAWIARRDLGTVRSAILTTLPPALAGLALERQVEERFGSRRQLALTQVAAGAVLALADRRPATRPERDAAPLDELAIGAAQAVALIPGVSRMGAALTVARARGFERAASSRLARRAALPVLAGAAALKGARGVSRSLAAPFAAGAAASLVSTLACAPLVRRLDRARSLAPFAAYRAALGAAVLAAGRSASMAP
ncbi:MAG: undecaprenyl-diphosphate phosphatase [Thermoleophilaceae bacterium]